jgi:hypothetical protein
MSSLDGPVAEGALLAGGANGRLRKNRSLQDIAAEAALASSGERSLKRSKHEGSVCDLLEVSRTARTARPRPCAPLAARGAAQLPHSRRSAECRSGIADGEGPRHRACTPNQPTSLRTGSGQEGGAGARERDGRGGRRVRPGAGVPHDGRPAPARLALRAAGEHRLREGAACRVPQPGGVGRGSDQPCTCPPTPPHAAPPTPPTPPDAHWCAMPSTRA